jgi:membrane associated rhomboid family serine protease
MSMDTRQNDRSILFSPPIAVWLLVIANVVSYAVCVKQTGTISISNEVLLRGGAMYSSAIARHEYWRLFTYGFLHVNLLHLATNMFCLVLWGTPLERRVGSFYFILIYACALVAGGGVSNVTQTGPYLSVGASGAISGVLGALLALWILGRIDVPGSFFVSNIGLNVALAAVASNIDWAAHAGGFVVGMTTCATLDVVEKLNARVLRCKFPEFVKFNILLILGASPLLFWRGNLRALASSESIPSIVAYLAACCLVVKLIDLVLSVKKGLAIIAFTFAVANAALILFAGAAFAPAFAAACSGGFQAVQIKVLRTALCEDVNTIPYIAALSAVIVTILLYWRHIDRGIKDVGFVGASLRAERKRRQGI